MLIWDLQSKKEVAKLQGHATKCTCLVGEMNGQTLVTGSDDTNVKVWDLRSNKCVMTFKEHSGAINCVQLSPDAKWVASGAADGALKIWDWSMGQVLANF